MDRSCNLVIVKNKQVKSYLIQIELVSNIHVNFFSYLAVVQLLSNSLNKVDIDLRNTLYN